MRYATIFLLCILIGSLACGCMSEEHKGVETLKSNNTVNLQNQTGNEHEYNSNASKYNVSTKINVSQNHSLKIKTEQFDTASLYNKIMSYDYVRNISLIKENGTVAVGVLVDSNISNSTAEKLACDAIRLAMVKYENITTTEETDIKYVGKSKYNYIVLVAYPNGTAAISGAKSADSESIVFGDDIFTELLKI